MRYAIVVAVTMVLGLSEAPVKPPLKVVIESKQGRVVFPHADHVKREKGKCAACHDKLVPRSAKAPLKSSTACGGCHRAGGAAFEMKGHCADCHQPLAAVAR